MTPCFQNWDALGYRPGSNEQGIAVQEPVPTQGDQSKRVDLGAAIRGLAKGRSTVIKKSKSQTPRPQHRTVFGPQVYTNIDELLNPPKLFKNLDL